MADMNMEMMMKDDPDMEMTPADMISGWAKTGTPEGQKALSYADLRYAGVQKDQRNHSAPLMCVWAAIWNAISGRLTARSSRRPNPSAEIWRTCTLNFTNETMMAHPMHLHGMFVQLENGQPAAKLPNKHTVIVPPGGSYSVLVTADEIGEWAFHCHLLYHMASGMMRQVVVAKLDAADMPAARNQSQWRPPCTLSVYSWHSASHCTRTACIRRRIIWPMRIWHAEHGGAIFHMFRLEADAGSNTDGTPLQSWDLDGWIGTDENKLWIKSEGERADSKLEEC
jgi:hypothetical protein